MGKRKNVESANPSKAKEIKIEPHDSDSEEFDEPIAVKAEETGHDEGPLNYEPDQFQILVESFNEYINVNQLSTSSVHNLEKYVADWIKNQRKLIDARTFTTVYRKYLRQSMKFCSITFHASQDSVKNYLRGEKSLPEFSSYPSPPPSKWKLYASKKNMNGFTRKSIAIRMRNDEEGSREVDEEHHELNALFITQLQAFLDSNPNLTEVQKNYIQNEIRTFDEKVNPKPGTSKTPRGKKTKKDPQTAFSLFCRSKADKYRDLSDGKREEKLQKEFAELPAGIRCVYERMAIILPIHFPVK